VATIKKFSLFMIIDSEYAATKWIWRIGRSLGKILGGSK